MSIDQPGDAVGSRRSVAVFLAELRHQLVGAAGRRPHRLGHSRPLGEHELTHQEPSGSN